MTVEAGPAGDLAGTLRRCLILLAALGVGGTALELALIRHWNGYIQLIPWGSLAVLVVAIVLVVTGLRGPNAVAGLRGPNDVAGLRDPNVVAGKAKAARVLIVLVLVSAVLGIYEHVLANYHAGPLDFRYSSKWATMSEFSRVWAALTESVGPSPTLAPLILAWSSLCLLFATIRFGADDQSARSGDRRDGRRRDGDRAAARVGRAGRAGSGSV